MTEDSSFKAHFRASITSALERARALDTTKNQQLKGQFREIIVSQLIKPILPPGVEIGSGQLLDYKGKSSKQIDVVIYSPLIAPPALIDEKNGFFPVESVLYTLEVKSKLTAQTLSEAITNAKSVRNLELLTGVQHERGLEMKTGTAWPVAAVLALRSDLSGGRKTEIARYREHDNNPEGSSAIAAICIPTLGYWHSQKDEAGYRWVEYVEPNNLSETLSFLGGLATTIPKILSLKGRIGLGKYLALDETFRVV